MPRPRRLAPSLSPAPRAPRVVGYARVSTEEQADAGVSLAAQEAKLRAYCALRDLELVAFVVDAGVSASKPLAARAGGARVLELARRREVDAVLGWKLDRLFRDCVDCLSVTRAWDRAHVALHLVDLGGQAVDTSSAMGRFFLTVMAGAAELERNQVRERTSAALQHKRALGQRVGAVPFGYALAAGGVQLVPVAAEQQVVRAAEQLRAEPLSLRAVAAALEAQGHRARNGRRFAAEQIARMLRPGGGPRH